MNSILSMVFMGVLCVYSLILIFICKVAITTKYKLFVIIPPALILIGYSILTLLEFDYSENIIIIITDLKILVVPFALTLIMLIYSIVIALHLIKKVFIIASEISLSLIHI